MLLIGTDDGIYRWAEGNNWPVFHALQGRSVVGLGSPGGGFLAAMDGGGRVWESGDSGLTWREATPPAGALGRPSAMAVGGTPASIVVAGKGAALHRRMLGTPSRGSSPLDLARRAGPVLIDRARSIVASRTKGGGAATAAPPARRPVDLKGWARLGSPKGAEAPGTAEVTSLAATPGGWFAGVAGEGLWRSVDSGATWARVEGLPATVLAVRPIPGRDGHLVAATSDGVWFSLDGGATWEERSQGLEAVKHVRAVAACPDEPDFLLAGAAPSSSASPRAARPEGLGYGLYESKDGGRSWAKVVRSFPERLQFDAITDIRFDPAAPDRAAVAFESGEMWMTLNGGDYWQPFARDIRYARVLLGIGAS